jgi:hypothetical protein
MMVEEESVEEFEEEEWEYHEDHGSSKNLL